MSSSSDLAKFDNVNGKKEHSANPLKLKRQKLSASSSGFRAGGQPIRVRRSRKRLQEVGTPTSTHHHPCTVLSWLIDNNVVQPTEKVHYCSTKGSHPMVQGKVSRKGIVCNCCNVVFSLSGFQKHAGCSNRRPAANIFIEDGKSLLDCQMQIMTKRRKRICGPEPHDMMKDNWPRDKNDSICTICQDGGDLILCDLCPSAFHKSCIGLKDVPDGNWFCPACCCGICGCSIEPTIHYHTCGQCERKYHTGCLRKRNVDNLESDPKGNWFCSDNCKKIFLGLHEHLGKQIPVGVDDLTWSLFKFMKPDGDNTNGPDNDAVTESYSRLSLALQVMQECFKHFKQPHTGRDLAEDIIFSRGSDLNGMNFQGFYTVVLEKNDELISVATVRIYGAKVAEVPLIGTRLQYRRHGMCRALMNLLEKMLMDLGVERLILPVVPRSLRKWKTSFGYSSMKDSVRLQLLDYRFMDFQDTIICQKPLLKIPLAEPHPSSERKANGFEHATAFQDTASSEQVCIEISDTSTDPPLVESEEAVQKSIGKCEKEIELKRRKLRLIQESLVECSNTLGERERKIREYNKAFSLLKQSMEEWCCKLELKQREFEGCVSKLELKEKEVELKVEELDLIGKRVSDCLDDARLKEKHVDLLEKSIQEGKQQLDAQQKSVQAREKHVDSLEKLIQEGKQQLDAQQKLVQARENNLDSLQKFAEERSKLLDLQCQGHERRERGLERRANELKFKERQVELKFDELNLKDKRVNECLNEVQLKEKHMDSLEKSIQADKQHLDSLQKSAAQREKQLDSLQKSVQESENNLVPLQKSVQERKKNLDSLSQELQRKEREVEQQAKELELQLKQVNSQVKMEQLEPTPAVENALVPSSASDDSTINMDGISLQLVMNEQVERIDLAGSRMSAVLQASSNPAKLVLDAMQGFYPSNLTENNREVESHLRVVRKSCILLLQELKRMSPLINPQVREEAMKLAADWKAEMTVAADNSWEILGFLWLINTYELTDICDSGELQSLVAMGALPEQTSELSRALGITDKAPGTNITSSIVKTERPESSLAINAATLSSSKNALQHEWLVTLQSSSDPAKLVLDMMQRAFTRYWTNGDISSKEGVVSAIRFLLKFLMEHSAPVGPHLKEDATNLAAEWKAKWIADTENSLESLGFLLFIAIYGLLGTLHEDEIAMLLGRISQHTRSLELCVIHGFVQYIPDFIQKLIKKKRVIEAVRSICTFKLIDKLLPVPLLQQYVEDAKKCSEVICSSPMTLDEKDNAVNGKIADLRAVIQCIKDYNLESDYPSKTVEMQIVQLDLLKEKCRRLVARLPSLIPKVERQYERKRKMPNTSSSAPKLQPGKLPKIKFDFGGSRP